MNSGNSFGDTARSGLSAWPRRLRRAAAFALCALLPASSLFPQETSPASWSVLLIFDEARDTPADVLFEDSVRAELAEVAGRRVEFFSEYLDSSRIHDDLYRTLFFDFLREKYRTRPPNVAIAFVISSGARLTARLREALPKVPVVKALFDPVGEVLLPSAPGTTGVVARADPGAMLDLARRLRPGAERLYLLAGDAPLDRRLTAHVLRSAAERPGLPPVETLDGRTFEQLRREVARLPAGSILLTTTFFRDASGESFRGAQVVAELSTVAPVPLLVLFDIGVGGGATGGVVLSVTELAKRTAGVALRVLRGAEPESIPVELLEGRMPIFDARALARWGIPESSLPPGSEVRFGTLPLWRVYPVGTAALAAILALQTGLIAGLLFERRRARRAEASLQAQAIQLSHLSRVSLLGTISASLAHELNQPLAAILANTQAGLRFLSRPEPDLAELRAILEDSARDVKRAGGVITSLRNILRHHERELVRIDLGELIHETLALLRSELVERSVDVAFQAQPGVAVPADRGQIQQVLLNLLLNAAEAVGALPAGHRRVEITARPAAGGAVRVVVADSGPGVPADQIDSIFDSFWTTKPHGMGMGLAICRTIVGRHGGRIWVENGSTGGARFAFELPPDNGSPAVPAVAPEPAKMETGR